MFQRITALVFSWIYSLVAPSLLAVPPVNGAVWGDVPTLSQEVTVMTFNLKVSGVGKMAPENRSDAVVALIRQVQPDSFGVQEASEFWMNTLQEALPEYSHIGVGRNSDFSGEAGAVFYLNTKYKAVAGATFWLSSTPDTPSRGWDAWINRVCSYAVLEDLQTGFRYVHFNAHFDNTGYVSRLNAAAVVAEQMKRYADYPAVFGGDLNDTEESEMVNRLESAGLRNTKYLAAETEYGNTYHGGNSMAWDDKVLDYFFVNNHITAVQSYSIIKEKVDGVYPSDHYPLVVKMTMQNRKETV